MKSVADFSFDWVPDNPLSAEDNQQIMHLWTERAGLKVTEANRRQQELVLITRERSGKIVGLATVYKARLEQIHNWVYLYRCFIDPDFRAPALDTQMLYKTKMKLEAKSQADTESKCVGVAIIIQNEMIKHLWNQAVWPGTEMIFIGCTAEGNHIRIGYFKNAVI